MNNEIIRKQVLTYAVDIFVAGAPEVAREVCQEFCLRGLCVSVSPCDFVYTGGRETGVRVGLINYPRFPSAPEAILATALDLAELLMVKMHQGSASVVASDKTVWLSRRGVE